LRQKKHIARYGQQRSTSMKGLEMHTIVKLATAAVLLAASTASVYAASDTAAPASSAQETGQMSEGEIRKVDKDAKKITIRHGELKNLDMPPMTMVFRVQDPAMVEQVKQGDKVSFVAEKLDGQLTVTQMRVKQ